MLKRIKSILFVICAVMVFTAQTNRPDDKNQGHAPAAKAVAHNNQSRTPPQTRQVQTRQVQTRQVQQRAPLQVVRRVSPVRRAPAYQPRQMSHVYASPAPAPVQNNRFLNRQHHNQWQPRYNFYDNQYHFYPYVNIASMVELSTSGFSVVFNGQNYFYDQGTFYIQDQNGQYEAVEPPLGIIVSTLPDNAHQINVDGQIYYRCKGVFYIQVAQGFQVIGPVQSIPQES